MRDDNEGELGARSIRLNGAKIQNLPIRESVLAQHQLPEVFLTERENAVKEVRAKYPRPKVPYLESRIRECQDTITRVNMLISQQNGMISEYTGWISIMDVRDELIAGATTEAERNAAEKRWPPYNREKLQTQIEQCLEAIKLANDVIVRENNSIQELEGVLSLCRLRDRELEALGADVE